MIKSAGRYEIVAELGRGGFGQVYKALDPTVNRMVAVKILTADGDTDTLTRFRNEAAASGRLHHPNIVTIFDFGEQDKVPYIVMELLEGQDLQRAIAERKPLALWEKVQIMSQVASGLGHAHAFGIVHRDVKPANVMLLPNGNIKIMDFGIALVSQATSTRLTPRGAMIGTFRYMAPEQFRGLSQDARSDIFAYGLMYYELLTGVHPFQAADAAAMMYNALNLDPVPVTELCRGCPAELQTIIERILQKDPDLRYQNLEDVLFDSGPMVLMLRRQRAQELLQQARAAREQGLLDNAQGLIRQVLEMDPAYEGAREFREQLQNELRRNAIRPRVDALVQKGRDEMSAGSPKEAVRVFESAVRLDPTNNEVQSLLEQARLTSEKASKVTQLVADAKRALRAGDFMSAKNICQQALELMPSEAQARDIFDSAHAALAEQERRVLLADELLRARRLIDIRSWDQAEQLLSRLAEQFPEVVEVRTQLELLQTGRLNEQRQNLLASGLAAARQEIQVRDFRAAQERLQSLCTEFPDSAEVGQLLQFATSEIETQLRRDVVERTLEEARVLAAQNRFAEAAGVLQTALSTYPTDPLLQREFRAVAGAKRRTAIQQSLTASKSLHAQKMLSEAASVLEAFAVEYGSEPSIDEFREIISQEIETNRRAGELRELVRRANEYLSQGQPAEATKLLQTPPSDLKDHPELTKLLSVAERQQGRATALEETLLRVRALESEGRFDEAVALLQEFIARYGQDPRVAEVQNTIQTARDARRRDAEIRGAVRQAKELLAQGDALEATRILTGSTSSVRDNSEASELLGQAQAELARQAERESVVQKTLSSVGTLRKEQRYQEALAILEEFHSRYGADLRVQELRIALTQDWDVSRLRKQEILDTLAQAERLLSRQDPEGAMELLKQVPPDMRNHPEAFQLVQLAETALQAKNFKIAVEGIASEAARLSQQGKLKEALEVLDGALRRFPGESALVVLHAEIAQACEAASRRQVLNEIELLCQKGEFATALKKLSGLDPDSNGELSAARERVRSLQQEAQHRQVAAAIREAERVGAEDPKRAVALLGKLEPSLSSQPEIQAAIQQYKALVVAANQREAIARVEDLCARGKFAKARADYKEIVTQFGASPDLDSLRARIEAGAPVHEISGQPPVTAGFPQKSLVRVGGILGVFALLAAGVWILTHRSTTPRAALVPVEIRTDPPGASVRLGNHTCQTPNCQLELPPGTYSVQAQSTGYEPSERTLTVDFATSPARIDIALKPITVATAPSRASGSLIVQGGTPDALVIVDNQPRGRTDQSGNLSLTLEAKTHLVRVQKLGYEIPRERSVAIVAKGSQSVSFSLISQNARLELRGAPGGVEVRAGNAILGRTGGSAAFSAQVPPGDQILRITEGNETRQVPQRFEPGQTVIMEWANVAPPRVPVPAPPAVAKTIDPAEQEWEQVRNTSDQVKLQEYLSRFPNGPHSSEAQNLLESNLWSRTNHDDIASLRNYINRFPRGPHAGEASSRMAELTWNSVDRKDESSLRNYLGQNPDGPYRAEAQRLLDQMRLDSERKKKNAEDQLRIEAEKAGPAADRQRIAQALAQYKQAYESKSVEQLKAVYPSLEGRTLESIRQAFRRADSIQIDLKPVKEPEISGDSATVRVERSFRQTEGGKALAPVQGTITINLRKVGQTWVIASIM